jgi:peptide/nickel transport system permease protein
MEKFQLSFLLTDWIVWSMVVGAIIIFIIARNNPRYREPWKQVLTRKLGMIAFVILSFYVATGLLDSIHFRVDQQTKSVLDFILAPLGQNDEKTYSSPFDTHLYTQDVITLENGKQIRSFAELKYADDRHEVHLLFFRGFVNGLASFALIFFLITLLRSHKRKENYLKSLRDIFHGKTSIAWREGFITFGILWILIFVATRLSHHFHILGTDKIGQDVFYQAIKSIRTGLLIGTLTTLFMLPIAVIFGALAGYFRGITDDIIQYLYTTLSSIPGILLITSAIIPIFSPPLRKEPMLDY